MSMARKPEPLMTPEDVAELLVRSVRWVKDPKTCPIPRVMIGRKIRFERADVDDWIINAKQPGRVEELRPTTFRSRFRAV